MSRSRTAYAQKTEPEPEMSEAEALQRLQTLNPRMMPYNTPAMLAKHYDDEAQTEENTDLLSPTQLSEKPKKTHGNYLAHPASSSHLTSYQQMIGEADTKYKPIGEEIDDSYPLRQETLLEGVGNRSVTATPQAGSLTLEIPQPKPSHGQFSVQRYTGDARKGGGRVLNGQAVLQPSPTDAEKSRPMKHLTCFFWWFYDCKYHPKDCLYAHYETGHIANAPILVEPGRSIAGGNLQNYLNNHPPVFRNHRVAHGLSGRRATLNSPRRPSIDPVIQQQIDHITAKHQQQRFVESYNTFFAGPQANTQLTAFVGNSPQEYWSPVYFSPLSMTSPNTNMPFSPEQASSGGIFTPHSTTASPHYPMGTPSTYALPPPPTLVNVHGPNARPIINIHNHNEATSTCGARGHDQTAPTVGTHGRSEAPPNLSTDEQNQAAPTLNTDGHDGAPPTFSPYSHHDPEPTYEELQSKVKHLEDENARLRKLNTTVIEYLLGTLYISAQNALFTKDVLHKQGVKLIELAKPLLRRGFVDGWNLPRGYTDVIRLRDGAVDCAGTCCDNLDKKTVHAREMMDVRKNVRAAIEKCEDEAALKAWDSGKSTWPYEKRFMSR